MIVFGLSKWLPLSLAALAVTGFVDMISVNIRQTAVTLLTPPQLQGRVSAVEWVFISASNELGAFESGAVARLVGTVPAVVAGGVAMIGDRRDVDAALPGARAHGPARGPAAGAGVGSHAWSRSTARRSGRTTSTASRATFYYSRYAQPDRRRGRGARSASSTAARRCSSRRAAGATTALVLSLLEPGDTIALAEGCYFGTGVIFQALARWGLRYVEFDQTGAAAGRRAARLARGAVEPVPDDARPRGRGRAPGAGRRRLDGRDARCTCGRSSTAPTSSLHSATKYLGGPRRRAARRRRLQGRGDGDELRDVPHPYGHRRRARSGLAAAARPEDARGARAAADRDGGRRSPSACARIRRSRRCAIPGSAA